MGSAGGCRARQRRNPEEEEEEEEEEGEEGGWEEAHRDKREGSCSSAGRSQQVQS